MEHLAFAPALSLASKIRHKDISARELLEFYLQRVEQYNPRLNAIIFRQDEKARQRADTADAALARGEVWGPLHGVPMTIKESFDWIGAADNYVALHCGPREFLIRDTIARVEQRLDPRRFVRIHRSTIVPIDRIVELVPDLHGDFEVRLKNGTALALSRTYRATIEQRFGRKL